MICCNFAGGQRFRRQAQISNRVSDIKSPLFIAGYSAQPVPPRRAKWYLCILAPIHFSDRTEAEPCTLVGGLGHVAHLAQTVVLVCFPVQDEWQLPQSFLFDHEYPSLTEWKNQTRMKEFILVLYCNFTMPGVILEIPISNLWCFCVPIKLSAKFF